MVQMDKVSFKTQRLHCYPPRLGPNVYPENAVVPVGTEELSSRDSEPAARLHYRSKQECHGFRDIASETAGKVEQSRASARSRRASPWASGLAGTQAHIAAQSPRPSFLLDSPGLFHPRRLRLIPSL